ncbi:MAG: amidase [Acidiferrobacteraceae bacterium]|nr:amidase [Acidiferrobacteraceae bacterium]
MSNGLWRLSAVEIAAGIRERRFSSESVVESVNERVASLNPQLNAIVDSYEEEAMAEARLADQSIGRGESAGPLLGVPVTIKSNIDVIGKPTPNGLLAFKENLAPADSPVVQNLRKAGAIIIGRTNTPELSMRLNTDNPLHGRTINPWDLEASPGGSSGGAGVSAAVGFGPIHHGNDIGGSLRCPASNCGVVTVKPTFGRIPTYLPSAPVERGMLTQLMSVQGAICREVRDLRLATSIMAWGDPRDPWWVPVPFDGPPVDRPIAVAVTKNSHGYSADASIISKIDIAAGYLSDAGYDVQEVRTPPIREIAQCWFDVLGSELDLFLVPLAKEHGSEAIQNIFSWYYELGDVANADQYRIGIKERTALTREWNLFLEKYPLVLTPYLMQSVYSWDYDAQGLDQVRDLFESAMYSTSINYLSLPAGVMPIGKARGLPTAIQIVGQRFREDLILDAMQIIERQTGIMAHELW